MAPQPASREGSIITAGQPTRRNSSSTTNTNVFSDEYALDSPGSMDDLSPVNSIQNSEDLTVGPRENTSTEYTSTGPRSALPSPPDTLDSSLSPTTRNARTNPAAIPHRAMSSITQSDVGTSRTFSTSSRFSVPRAHSPYSGPTAPSQPYALYPQVTRASSVASESTIRPIERPFVSQGGPEHPYAMYQNTVPEEDDGSSANIPPGFPAMNSRLREGSRSSGNDTGDIVGTDGHVESLPPYTRYADNVVAKGDMAEIEQPRTVESESSPTDPTAPDSTTELSRTGTEAVEGAGARKEGWRTRAKRRKCCGLPCCMVLVIIVIVCIAAAIGGIIGGIIGNKQGVESAESDTSATTTVWLDADPVETGPATPPCPTGHYTIPLNQTEQVEQCILNPALQQIGSWDCMKSATLGVSVFNQGPGYPPIVVFDDYSLRPQLFRYGPQPPDFNQTQFTLKPVKDKQDSNYGVAMFFSSLFDKIVILEEDALHPSKRSVSLNQLNQRQNSNDFGYLAVGDNPWYCFWNSTVEEFWVFLEKDFYSSTPSTAAAASTTTVTAFPSNAWPAGYSPSYTPGGATAAAASTTDANAAASTYASRPPKQWTGPDRRDYPDPGGLPEFPRLVKMIEKRKPQSNVKPYCQQMEVMQDWAIVPKQGVPIVCIEEAEYAQSTAGSKRWIDGLARRGGSTVQELESMCICEWMST